MYTCHPKKIAFKGSRDVTVAKNLAVCRDIFMPPYDILRPEKTSFLPLSTERISKESYESHKFIPRSSPGADSSVFEARALWFLRLDQGNRDNDGIEWIAGRSIFDSRPMIGRHSKPISNLPAYHSARAWRRRTLSGTISSVTLYKRYALLSV